MRASILLLCLLGCGSQRPAAATCPTPWSAPSPSQTQLSTELDRPQFRDVSTCTAGFMGWTSVSRLRLNGSPPDFKGDPLNAQESDAMIEGLRAQLPELIGDHAWTPIRSGRVVNEQGDTNTRVLYSGADGLYLFIFEHAG